MFLVSVIVLVSFLIIVLLKALAFLLSEKVLKSREELSSYECGFEHHTLSRIPFSLRYFFLTLVFLLFDLEIVLLLFTPFVVFFTTSYLSLLIVLVFILILFISLLYEWVDGTLEWLN